MNNGKMIEKIKYAIGALHILWVSHHANRGDAAIEGLEEVQAELISKASEQAFKSSCNDIGKCGCARPCDAPVQAVVPPVSQEPVVNTLLTQLLDSVEGYCYMGNEWELATCKELRKMSPPDYEALKTDVENLTKIADGTLFEYDKLKAENEALKLEAEKLHQRVAELEEKLYWSEIGIALRTKTVEFLHSKLTVLKESLK